MDAGNRTNRTAGRKTRADTNRRKNGMFFHRNRLNVVRDRIACKHNNSGFLDTAHDRTVRSFSVSRATSDSFRKRTETLERFIAVDSRSLKQANADSMFTLDINVGQSPRCSACFSLYIYTHTENSSPPSMSTRSGSRQPPPLRRQPV